MQSKNKELSTILKEGRRSLKMSQEQASKFLGVTQSQYSKIEIDPCKSRLDYFILLVQLFEIDHEKLIKLLF